MTLSIAIVVGRGSLKTMDINAIFAERHFAMVTKKKILQKLPQALAVESHL